ncbi:MAG: molecular chaperone DnaJ [Curvibacter sp.]|nr:MAG: molecular chaperone DnaJ [Curvibacter sp.]
MDKHEAYRELGLPHTATDEQLKAAWRRLVSRWHPDRNPSRDAAHRTQRINKAYHHLRNLRDEEADAPAAPPQPASKPAPKPRTEKAPPPPPPREVTVRQVSLSLEEATLGCVRTLRGRFTHACGTCQGQGHRVLASACTRCQGKGTLPKPALFGWLWTQETCPDCEGDGRQRERCAPCEGKGQRSISYRRHVRIPPGVRAGDELSVPGTLHDGIELGLELRLAIEPHPFFTLEDGQLRCEIPVCGYAWAANQWVEVPAPEGLQHMRLNRDALVYRLRGQGFPERPNGPRGDYIVKVVPSFPETPTAEQQALLDQLAAASARAAEAQPDSALGRWRRQLAGWQAKAAPGTKD